MLTSSETWSCSILDLHLFLCWDKSLGMSTGDAYFSGHLVPSLWNLQMFFLMRPILFRTCRYLTGLCSSNIPRYFLDFALLSLSCFCTLIFEHPPDCKGRNLSARIMCKSICNQCVDGLILVIFGYLGITLSVRLSVCKFATPLQTKSLNGLHISTIIYTIFLFKNLNRKYIYIFILL